MGVLFDYFMAPSRDEAAATIDWVSPSRPPEIKRGFLRRPQSEARPYRSIPFTGIDPVVMLGTLEELLTGRSYEEIVEGDGELTIAERNGGEQMVVAVRPSLTNALASSSERRLAEVAVPWSQTEEFWGDGDPKVLTAGLSRLAALAREAKESGQQIYCWVSV